MSMRVGPLSNAKVIEYINQHFVPVFTSNEDILGGKVSGEEKRLLLSIRKSAVDQGMSDGAVHVYLVKPNLQVDTVLHVAKAANIRQLMPWLRTAVAKLKVTPGKALLPSRSTTKPPALQADELLLQVRSQFNDNLSPYVDDWVVLKKSEWQQFVQAPQGVAVKEWTVDDAVAKKILVHLYPYAADWNIDFSKIKSAEIGLRAIEDAGRQRKLVVSGSIERVQNRQPGKSPTPLYVEIVGIVTSGSDGRPAIALATFKAKYGNRLFDGMVNSIAVPVVNSVKRKTVQAP